MSEIDPSMTQNLAVTAELFRQWFNRRQIDGAQFSEETKKEFEASEEYACALFDFVEKRIEKYAGETIELAQRVGECEMLKTYGGAEKP